MALFPQLAKRRERYSLIRSMEAWDSVHFRAQYYVQSGHMMNPALQKELPPIGTVVAYESAARRQPTDMLPGYVAVNVTQSQAGCSVAVFFQRPIRRSYRHDERNRRHLPGR